MPTVSPTPFLDALRFWRRKRIVPTSLTSAQLSELSQQVRDAAVFSAQTLMEPYLLEIQSALDDAFNLRQERRADRVTPENPEGFVTVGSNPADVRVRLKQKLQELGYQPSDEDRGTIKDLASDQRVKLVEEMNRKSGQSFAQRKQQESALVLFPAMELFRAEDRKERRNWIERFRIAGEASGRPLGDGWGFTSEGQMIALVGHPLWEQLGSTANFADATGSDRFPFAWNSGMETRAFSRRGAVAAGIMREDQVVEVEPAEFESEVAA